MCTQAALTNPHHREHDEIQRFTDSRYLSPVESCWRLFGFSTCGLQPPVTRL